MHPIGSKFSCGCGIITKLYLSHTFNFGSKGYNRKYENRILIKNYTLTFIHGIFLAVSSASLLSLGLSGG
jgi:hypothetical protein